MSGGEGTAFGKYHLIKRLAMGGMGEIFLAKLRGPVGFKKLLVIKRILQHHSANEEFVNMFLSEARITAQLSHPHIVQIYEMGEIEDCLYLAMEYVHGKSLREVIDRNRKLGQTLHPAHAIHVISDLCGGLSFAHNAKDVTGEQLAVIHRDINPQNLLISYTGDLKLIDFGIAKSEITANRTESGTIKGKFVYMSPEQTAAGKLDKRSDLFSVGIVLYETLTGVNPFVKSNAVLSMDAIQRFDPGPVSAHNRKLAPFDPIIAKALAKRRDERYADCSDLAEELQGLLRNGILEPAPTSIARAMEELFEEQIQGEQRLLAAALENTNNIPLDGPPPTVVAPTPLGRGTRGSAPVEGSPREPPRRASAPAEPLPALHAYAEDRSRIPFFLLLGLIFALTAAGSVWVTRATFARRQAEATQREIERTLRGERGLREQAADVRVEPRMEELVIRTATDKPATDRPSADKPSGKQTPERPSQPVVTGTHEPDERKPPRSRPKGERNAERERDRGDKNERPDKTADKAPPPAPALGTLSVATTPSVRLKGGSKVRLTESTGEIAIGGGQSATDDPIAVVVRYELTPDGITYVLRSEPEAIVRCSGPGVYGAGKVPQTVKSGAVTATCTFTALKEPDRKLEVSLRFSR